jgi:HD-GYP domain-containing protein (c-di-GMP phosphodiesterase class II)
MGAAVQLGLAPADVRRVNRAGLVHDLGRVSVPLRVWEKSSKLATSDWEMVRLHAYHSERVLARSPLLSDLIPVAGLHHERLDGSGYHRGSGGATLDPQARLLAVADAYHAMREPRPYRPALPAAEAAASILDEARGGLLDPEAVAAVLQIAGEEAPSIERPAGLTERQVEVVRLLVRGLQTKQIARQLDISAKTADRHIQNAYRKMGVSTRAGAALFAMQRGLTSWGEFPIGERTQPS